MVSRMFRCIRQTFGVITSTFTILSQAHPTRGEKRDIPPKWWLDGDEEVIFSSIISSYLQSTNLQLQLHHYHHQQLQLPGHSGKNTLATISRPLQH